VLARALVPERAIVTLAAGELVGLVGFHLGGSSFAEIRLRHLVAEFGWTGVPHWALLALLARRPREGELLLDGIVVRPDSRGQGIGTALLREVEALARGHGLEAVRLDVVDTNPDARRLYEREGFVATTTHRSPFLGRLFGFSASTTMVKAVGRGPDEMGRGDREPSAAEDGRCGARVDRRADTDCRSNVGAHPRDFDLERME
jgi:GNAT superfamily N-acetyltransferase